MDPLTAARPEQEPTGWVERNLMQMDTGGLVVCVGAFFLPMLIFAIVALVVARHPAARKKAMSLLVICILWAVAVAVMATVIIMRHHPKA